MSYKDIEVHENLGACHVCDKLLKNADSPWSICFDPFWKTNVWGGDSHIIKALLCQECAEHILAKTGP